MTEHLISLYNLENRFHLSTLWGVRYRFGAKFDDLESEHPIGRYVDCSGYIRWLVYHGSNKMLLLPDGSYVQHTRIQQLGFPMREYRNALLNETSAVYICFLRPTSHLAGHVWLLRNGRTMESHFGKGIDSRSGKLLSYLGRKVYCYRLS